MKNYFENIIKKASGLFNSSAVPFQVVPVRDEHYKALYYDAITALQNGINREVLRVDVDDYILTVIVDISATISRVTEAHDDMGLSGCMTDSVINVEVLDYYMIDDNCAGIECDFDRDRFEKLF